MRPLHLIEELELSFTPTLVYSTFWKSESMTKNIGIIGAGPAGLTAAYLLSKKGVRVTVFESDPDYVGGISRTVSYKGFHFDIGGHRFFSKSKVIEDLWTELLPDDMILRPRSSRIFYQGKFYSYPLKAMEALQNLGIFESGLCVASYIRARLFPERNPRNFEDWTSNHFGKRLYNIFFKTYTEKVWGMSCRDISADWAQQRIKGLSLGRAILHAVLPKKTQAQLEDKSNVVKTLIDSFRYPRRGPGMLWESCAERVRAMGAKIHMGQPVRGLERDAQTGQWRVFTSGSLATEETEGFDAIITSAPMRETVLSLAEKLPREAVKAAESLRYRDFLTVVLILKDRNLFQDNWIYIHDPKVRVGRIQNFKSWSPEMVPDPDYCCYGLEYFCFEGDGLWESSDEALIALAKAELETIGLAGAADVLDGHVVRQLKAYPVYDDHYATHVETIRLAMRERFPELHFVGRNGMHKYNNQDHAMMTAILTVENILAGRELFNVWQVNEDAEYHEAGERGAEDKQALGLRMVPIRHGI